MSLYTGQMPDKPLDDSATYREAVEDELQIIAASDEKLTSAAWWNEVLEGHNTVTGEVPSAIARLMANLDGAIREMALTVSMGNSPHFCAVTSALVQLRRAARPRAITEARDEAEAAQ